MPISDFLEYLYDKFAVTFILCIVGVFIKECIGNVRRNKKFKVKRILSSVIVSTAIMCAIGSNLSLSFEWYALVNILFGAWSNSIASFVLSSKFMTKYIPKFLHNLANPIAKTIADVLEDDDNDKKDSKKSTSKKDKKENKDEE